MCSRAVTPAPITGSLHGGGAAAGAQSWIQRWGRGAQAWEYMLGPSPPPDLVTRRERFHFRFLESCGLFGTWKVTPHLHDKGGGGAWHWLWGELWLHHTPGHPQKGGVSPGRAPVWDQVLRGSGTVSGVVPGSWGLLEVSGRDKKAGPAWPSRGPTGWPSLRSHALQLVFEEEQAVFGHVTSVQRSWVPVPGISLCPRIL